MTTYKSKVEYKKMTNLTKIEELSATWFLGPSETEPLLNCSRHATSLKHKFIVAFDYMDETMTKPTKVYGSYKTSKIFYKKTKHIPPEERCFYVVIPENAPCCLFSDLEWDLSWKSVDEIKQKYIQVVTDTIKNTGIELLGDDFLFCNASEQSTNKGSLHAHIPCVLFNNIQEQQRFVNAVKIVLDSEDDWSFIDESDKSFILKTFIDFGVYNKNRQIRLPYSSKKKVTANSPHGIGVRPLIPENTEDFDITEWSIIDTEHCDGEPVDVTSYPADVTCNKRHIWSKTLVQGVLDQLGLDVSVDTFKGNNLISLKNKTKLRICPIRGEENKSDNAYLVIKDNKLHYHCHDEGCKGQSKVIHEFQEKQTYMFTEPPFKKYYNDFAKNEAKYIKVVGKCATPTPAYNDFIKRFMTEMNQYCVVITGNSRPYILYRTEKQTSTGKVVNWIAKFFDSFLSTYKVYTHSVYFGPRIFLNSTLQRRFLEEDCKPLEKPTDCPPQTFNTFQGLAISKEQALMRGKKDPTKLLDFILVCWCSGDKGLFNHVMDWFAHLVQKPWIKMKASLVLQGLEGTGKGMIIQLLGKIIGEAHFFQPSSQEDMFGSFNYMMDNRLLCFADEMFWGGDKKKSGQLKKLLTEDTRCSNTKYGPIRRLTNMINWIFASNEQWVVPAGARARRYTILEVTNTLYDMNETEKKELYNFCPYSFANFLYNRDISQFNPHKHYKTEGLKKQKELSMSTPHKFWCKYLEEEEEAFGRWAMKEEIFSQFSDSQVAGYKTSEKGFWMDITKIYGTLPSKRIKDVRREGSSRPSSGKKHRYIQLPPHNEAIELFNKLYDCKMVEVEEEVEEEKEVEVEEEVDVEEEEEVEFDVFNQGIQLR